MPLSTPKKQFDAAVSYSPTLSELIEACHQDGVCMRLIERPDGTWITSRADEEYFHGRTPQEAVARLWLALNKS
jgi:hypothetical protein